MTAADWALLTVLAVATALVPTLLLHRLARRVEHWLVACLAAGGLYVAVSLRLDQLHAPSWLDGVRWGLLAIALYSVWRYWQRRRQAHS